MAEGDQAVAGDRHFQAIEAYSGAVALKPDSMLAHLKRGAVYQNQNELDAALRDLREAVDLDPGALLAIELLGDVNTSLQRAERAIERYETYVSLDERNARVHYKLGLARYRAGRVDPAATALQQALNLDPALGDAHYVLGLVLRDQNKLPAARRSLEESARRLPAGQTAPREALAEVYALMMYHRQDEAAEQGFPPKAYAAWRGWYDTTPDTPCIAICSTSQGDPVCKGCGRSFEEVQYWTEMSPGAKRHVWRRITLSRSSWRFHR